MASAHKRIPQYRAIHTDMVARICQGEWPVGEAIQPLSELTAEYGASRMTVLKALHLLEAEEYVSVEQGRGTFVSDRLPGRRIAILCGDDVLAVPSPVFATGLSQGLRDWLWRAEFRPQLYVVDSTMLGTAVYPSPSLWREVKRGLTDGLALVATEPLPNLIADATERGLPLVDLGGNVDYAGHVGMDIDDMLTQSLRYLAERGHRRIGYIATDFSREFLFRAECRRLQVQTRDDWVVDLRPGDHHGPVGDGLTAIYVEAEGFAATSRLWRCDDRPEALIVGDDIAAKGVAQAALALSIRVPEELTVVAQATTSVPMFYPVPVVRFEFDTAALIEQAGNLLLTQLRGGAITRCKRIRGRIRETAAGAVPARGSHLPSGNHDHR